MAVGWTAGLAGPDAFLEVVTTPGLVARVRARAPRELVRAEIAGPLVSAFGGELAGRYDAYVARARAAEVLARLRGEAGPNLYLYRVAFVADDRLWIEDGGLFGDAADAELDAALVATAVDDGLLRWSIRAGGDGYPIVTVAEGTTAASLLDRLAPG